MTPDLIAQQITHVAESLGYSGRVFLQAPPPAVSSSGAGDLATDVGLALAGALRVSPTEACERIIAKLPEESQRRVTTALGFINISVDELPFHYRNLAATPPQSKQVVVLPQPSEDFSGWGYLRLYARAWVQIKILRYLDIPSQLLIAGDDGGEDPSGSLESISALALRRPSAGSHAQARERLVNAIADTQDPAMKTTVWLPSNYFDQKVYAERFTFNKERTAVRSPDRGMLLALPDEDIAEYFSSKASGKLTARLLWYLASGNASVDLDVSIPSFDEAANLPWYFAATLARLVSRSKPTADSAPPKTLALHEPARALRSLLGTICLCLESAAVHGTVEESISTLEAILLGVNKTLNFGFQHETDEVKETFWGVALHQLRPLKSLLD